VYIVPLLTLFIYDIDSDFLIIFNTAY